MFYIGSLHAAAPGREIVLQAQFPCVRRPTFCRALEVTFYYRTVSKDKLNMMGFPSKSRVIIRRSLNLDLDTSYAVMFCRHGFKQVEMNECGIVRVIFIAVDPFIETWVTSEFHVRFFRVCEIGCKRHYKPTIITTCHQSHACYLGSGPAVAPVLKISPYFELTNDVQASVFIAG